MNYEIIGLLATLFVLLSFLMKKIELVRVINIVGAAMFVVYGVLINAFSTWILNVILIVIHIVYLIIYLRKKRGKKQ